MPDRSRRAKADMGAPAPNRRDILLGGPVLGAAALIAPAQAQQQPISAGGKPNIVFNLMDNLGYGEPGCYGGGAIRGAPTPRIDKLATEGTRLTLMSKRNAHRPIRR